MVPLTMSTAQSCCFLSTRQYKSHRFQKYASPWRGTCKKTRRICFSFEELNMLFSNQANSILEPFIICAFELLHNHILKIKNTAFLQIRLAFWRLSIAPCCFASLANCCPHVAIEVCILFYYLDLSWTTTCQNAPELQNRPHWHGRTATQSFTMSAASLKVDAQHAGAVPERIPKWKLRDSVDQW